MTKITNKTVDVVFAGLLSVILLATAVSLAETVFQGWIALVIGVIILGGVLFVTIRGRDKICTLWSAIQKKIEPIPPWKLALFLGLFSAISKIIMVFLFDNNADLHPDMAMYRSYAQQYAENGKIIENAGYAYMHSYMAIFGLILSPFAKLFGADTKVFTTVLSVLHAISMVMLFDLLKSYARKEGAFITILLYSILPAGLLQTQLLTHENALFFFHIFAVWLFMNGLHKDTHWLWQIVLIILSAVVLSVGKSVNAAGQVFFISFAIYAMAKLFSKGFRIRECGKFICVLLILCICFSGSTSVCRQIRNTTLEYDRSDTENTYSLSYGWSLYVGANYESAGMWTETDRTTYNLYQTMNSRDEALDYQRGLLEQRFQAYKDEPIRIFIHLFNKIKVLWGTQLLPFAYEQGNAVNEFVLYGLGGIINKMCILLNSASALLLYSILLISIVWKKSKSAVVTPDLHFRMAIIGVTFALLLFEVTPKYVSHLHIGFYSALALTGKYYLADRSHNREAV